MKISRYMKCLTLIGVIGLPMTPLTFGQDDAAERGERKFDHSCTPCHGAGIGDDGHAMLPGTEALWIKYQGAIPALLEERTDLTAEIIRVYLRNGSWSMPPFRPTEITDDDIEDIAAYLAKSSAAADR